MQKGGTEASIHAFGRDETRRSDDAVAQRREWLEEPQQWFPAPIPAELTVMFSLSAVCAPELHVCLLPSYHPVTILWMVNRDVRRGLYKRAPATRTRGPTIVPLRSKEFARQARA